MKTLIKLILIGLIAGSIYKYMTEKDIKVAEKGEMAFEWISGKIEILKDAAMQDNLNDADENSNKISSPGGCIEESYSSQPIMNTFSQDSRNTSSDLNESEHNCTAPVDDMSDAIKYNIMAKDESNIMILRELDTYAINSPAEVENSIPDLVEYLTGHASDELEIARLLFTWVATHIAYDDHGFNTGDYADCSAEEVLRNRVSVCEGYSNLLVALGNRAGINTVKISGYAKGIRYKQGDRINETNHAWNAMMIDGVWRLIDVTWAAGYGMGVNGRLVSVKQFDDYWFNTEPAEFIFTHLPSDDSWQFLDKPVSQSLFESMPYASSDFFKLGFKGTSCLEGIVNGTLRHLPLAYNTDCELKLLSMPLDGVIEAGTAMKLLVQSEMAESVALKNKGQWAYFEKKGNKFELTIRPEHGEMKLMADFKGDGLPFHTVLKYRVE